MTSSSCPAGKAFRLAPSLDDQLTAERLARCVAELVDEHLDLAPIRYSCTEVPGAQSYDPRPLVRILLYGYITGVRSSRAIERRCEEEPPFRWLAAGAAPDYRAIIQFRRVHLAALWHLFVQALALCQAADMVTLVRVAQDGRRSRVNIVPEAAAAAMLADAEQIDKVEDA